MTGNAEVARAHDAEFARGWPIVVGTFLGLAVSAQRSTV